MTTRWKEWTDAALVDYEERLYDREVEGEDVWHERDQLLWEMTHRGLIVDRSESPPTATPSPQTSQAQQSPPRSRSGL